MSEPNHSEAYETLTNWNDILRPGDEFRNYEGDWLVTHVTGITLRELARKSHNMITEFRRPIALSEDRRRAERRAEFLRLISDTKELECGLLAGSPKAHV